MGSATSNTLNDYEPISGANYYKVKAVNDAGESDYSSYAYCNYSGGGHDDNIAKLRFDHQYFGGHPRDIQIYNSNGSFSWTSDPSQTGMTEYFDIPSGYSRVVIRIFDLDEWEEEEFYYDFESGRKYTMNIDNYSITDDGSGGDNKPNPPTGVTASQSGTSIVVSWNSVSNATSYKVYRSSSSYGTYYQVGSSTSSTQLSDNDPFNGDNYYKVKAVNSAGESDYSDYAYGYYSGGGHDDNTAKLRFDHQYYGGYPLDIYIYNSNGSFYWFSDPSQTGMTEYFDIPSGYSRVVIENLVWEEEDEFYYDFESGRKYTMNVDNFSVTDDGPM